MHIIATPKLTTAFLALVLIPTTYGAVTSLTIPEITVDEGILPSGPTALRNAYLKFGHEPPTCIAARAPVDATVTATPTQGDAEYLVPVAVGSPSAVTYTMNFDTGSSSFTLYAPKLGKSGSVTTTVNMGGAIVTKQVVNLNSDSSGGSNVVGMTYTTGTFYSNAVAQGSIAAVFAANLKKGAPGTYTLGFINTASYTGSITYVTVNTAQGFWEFTSNGYAIGSGAFVTNSMDSVVDTGTTLLLLPQAVVTAYYAQVSGSSYSNTQGGYVFPCSATLPNLILGIGTYRATVPGSYINYAPTGSGSSTCFGGLQADTGIGFSIFGLVFIKSQFVVFKGTSSPTLGFAQKA